MTRSLGKGESPIRTLRVPDELWNAYLRRCARLDRTPAQMLREHIKRVASADQTNDN